MCDPRHIRLIVLGNFNKIMGTGTGFYSISDSGLSQIV